MLLKYLTDNNVPVTNNNFTKTTLVDQVIEYWRNPEGSIRYSNLSHAPPSTLQSIQQLPQLQSQLEPIYHDQQVLTDANRTEHFPINLMARNFSNWFYKNFNECTIQPDDFWNDATCIIRLIDSSGEVKEDSTITSRLVLNLMYAIKGQFNFFFNPNLSHDGTRGK